MGLFGRKKTSVGIDIGSGFIKLVEVDHSGDQPEGTRVAMRPLEADAIVEGEVMDPDSWGFEGVLVVASRSSPADRPEAASDRDGARNRRRDEAKPRYSTV